MLVRYGRCSSIQHNVRVLCEARRPPAQLSLAAFCGSYRIIHIMSCAPAFRAGVQAALPGGFRHGANPEQTSIRQVGLRPPLKGVMPARCVCLRRLAVVPPCSFPPRQSSPPPQCGVVMHTQRPVMQRCHRAPKGASGLYAARTGKTRVPCSGKLSRVHGLRLKTNNDSDISAVKMAECRRYARAGR